MRKLALVGLFGLCGLLGFSLPKTRAEELILNGVTNVYFGPVTNDCSGEVIREKEYHFHATSSEIGKGYVSGNTNSWIALGGTGIVEAVAYPYYVFSGWNGSGLPEGVNTNSEHLEIAVTEPLTNIVANFKLDETPEKQLQIGGFRNENGTNIITTFPTYDISKYSLNCSTNLLVNTWDNVVSNVPGTGVYANNAGSNLEFRASCDDVDVEVRKFYRVSAE